MDCIKLEETDWIPSRDIFGNSYIIIYYNCIYHWYNSHTKNYSRWGVPWGDENRDNAMSSSHTWEEQEETFVEVVVHDCKIAWNSSSWWFATYQRCHEGTVNLEDLLIHWQSTLLNQVSYISVSNLIIGCWKRV